MTVVSPVRLLIDGEAPTPTRCFEVRDPGRHGDVVAEVAAADPTDVDRAVSAAENGGTRWSRIELDERCDLLCALADDLLPLAQGLASTLARENGAVLREARLDLARGLAVLRSTAEAAKDFLRPRTTDSGEHWLRLEKKPVGVIGMIIPWNSPIVLALSKVGPALAAGNGIVVKPSPEAPVALTRLLGAVADRLPAGTLNVVNGDVEVGEAICAHPKVRMISFTGSVTVGRTVMRSAADTIKRVALELGGNDPAIVLDDVDLDAILPSLCLGAFTRAGQICFAVKRVYLPRRRYDEMAEALCAHVDGYRVGHGLDPETTFGPLINRRQQQRVAGLVERAGVEGEARQLGGFVDPQTADDGWYLRPTVVLGLDQGAELVGVEQFGPVLPLVAYDRLEEAIAMANDSEFGLASSVWATDLHRAVKVAGELEAGATFVNSHNLWSLSFDMPFGGVKQSGIGRERTELGIQEYVEDHAIRMPRATN